MNKTRSANWLKVNDDKLFYWHHSPSETQSNTAIIILGPVGPEYMHCFRSIKYLADSIAESGFHCIRYDPIGMGNSSGDLENNDIWDKWKESPKALSHYLQEKFDVENIVLVGLRSGCLILSQIVNNVPALKASVFWYPYTRGAAYIRDIELLDSMLYENTNTESNATLNGGGYPITQSLKAAIKEVNLLKLDYTALKQVLVINSQEITKTSKLHDLISSQDINSTSLYLDGLDAMTKQVAISKIPFDNIEQIIDWLAQEKGSCITAQTNQHEPTIINEGLNFKETIITINQARNIFAILTTPNATEAKKIVIIPNTGAAHHVGPNRFHVDIARINAQQGIATLRIDLSNLGDSTHDYSNEQHHPYPACATEDINAVISYVENELHFNSIILCGLCSGAHNIFHAALNTQSKNIKKLILINPETFSWNPNQGSFSSENTNTEIDQMYYKKQMYNYKKWLSLIVNPVKLINTASFVFVFLYKKLKFYFRNILSITPIKFKTKLESQIMILASKNIPLVLIHSEDDPGYKILISQANNTIKKNIKNKLFVTTSIKDADHTFSSIKSRTELYQILVNSIS